MANKNNQKVLPKPVKFLNGGLAGMMATCIVQPLDLVKNRMQFSTPGQFRSSGHCLLQIIKTEGLPAIYTGLSAGLLRQLTYTTTRLGIFTSLLESGSGPNGQPPPLHLKIVMAMVAGGIGAFVGTPTEVALIRMSSDGRLPLDQRRNYKHAVDAMARTVREEGVKTLWRGCIPTVSRAMILNAAQLASYAHIKQMLLASKYNFKDNIFCHFVAAMCSGMLSTIISMPIDIVKTRLQGMKAAADGTLRYTGTVNCFGQIVRHEGVFALWKGFTPYYFRLGPHTVFTFIFLEQLTKAYRQYS